MSRDPGVAEQYRLTANAAMDEHPSEMSQGPDNVRIELVQTNEPLPDPNPEDRAMGGSQ
jgi:hypothetical protein